MAEIAETVYETKKGKVVFNPEGLSNIEAGRVKNIALSVFHTLAEDAPYRLEICIFYADPGYDALSEEIEEGPDIKVMTQKLQELFKKSINHPPPAAGASG